MLSRRQVTCTVWETLSVMSLKTSVDGNGAISFLFADPSGEEATEVKDPAADCADASNVFSGPVLQRPDSTFML